MNLVVRIFREKKDGGEETEEGEKKGHFMDASQTATDRHRQAQTGTDSNRQAQAATGKHRQAQTATDRRRHRHAPTLTYEVALLPLAYIFGDVN